MLPTIQSANFNLHVTVVPYLKFSSLQSMLNIVLSMQQSLDLKAWALRSVFVEV